MLSGEAESSQNFIKNQIVRSLGPFHPIKAKAHLFIRGVHTMRQKSILIGWSKIIAKGITFLPAIEFYLIMNPLEEGNLLPQEK